MKKCVKIKRKPGIDVKKLQDPTIRNEFRSALSLKLTDSLNAADASNIDEKWNVIKAVINDVSTEKLKTGERVKLKPWMTDEILDLMDQRRKFKNKDEVMYHTLQRNIRSKIRQAKEEWLTIECKEIETLEAKHDSFNVHKKVKQAAGVYRSRGGGILTDGDGNILLSTVEKLNEWKGYIATLFNDQRSAYHNITCDDGLDITRDEVVRALKLAKSGKAPGPDDIHVEVLKILTDDQVLSVIVDLFNN